jgi:membrane-bound lytic murein transglycosylase B
MDTAYQTRRAELQTYFDETASVTWQKLTSNAPVSGIRATVRAGREAMHNEVLSWLPQDMTGLRILDAGHIAPERMKGSHAGAMGQPQFMPSSFERLAMDFDGDGRRDIWDNRADALGSIGNYLARNGWREGEAWGFEVVLPAGFDRALAEPSRPRPATEWPGLDQWARMGVRRADGGALGAGQGGIILPANQERGFQAFMALPNFHAIRRYNPSNFYALTVGMLGDRVTA